MKLKMRQIITWILLILMFSTTLSITIFSEEEPPAETYRDVVLVLDCSGSMLNADPFKLCATACKLLVDQIPLKNARIAILAFGYNGGSAYQLKNYTIENPTELNLINIVTPLQETASLSGIENLKETIDVVTEKRGNATPTGTALLCATDLLENAGSTDKNACIVLIGDGECTSNINPMIDSQNVETAVKRISSHNWPVFALQVNSDNIHDEESVQTKRMKHLAYDCGQIALGYENDKYCYFNLTSFEQGDIAVSEAASNIFAWVANSFPPPEPEKYELPADITYDVPNLASEFNITLLGEGLRDITITFPDGEKKYIDGNIAEEDLLTSIIEGRYYNIKLFCPKEGQYTVHVGGDKGKVAVSLDVGTMDTELKLTSNPTLSLDTPLGDKKTKIHFSSCFSYRDTDILNNRCYDDIPAVLEIKGTNGDTEIPLIGDKSTGYYADITASDLSHVGPAFSVRVAARDNSFTEGCKYSKPIQFKMENIPTALIDPDIPDMNAGVNQQFEIDLKDYFNNPDNDAQDVVIECLTDRNKEFSSNCENDYLKIDAGLDLGAFDVKLKVRDYDMKDYLESNPFTLTVSEEPFVFEEIEVVEVWISNLPKALQFLQEPGPREVSLNLADYYYDPDGLPAQYGALNIEGDGTLFDCKQEGALLTFTPLEKGNGTVSFTVSDGYNEQGVSFRVKVVSGWSKLFSDNVALIVICAIALAVLILTLVVINANTRVKGKWDITISADGEDRTEETIEGIDLHINTSVGKKKKFLMKDMLMSVTKKMEHGSVFGPFITDAFRSASAAKITMKGVLSGKGCVFMNLPTQNNDSIEVSCNGRSGQKKYKTSYGTVELRFKEANLTIEFKLH